MNQTRTRPIFAGESPDVDLFDIAAWPVAVIRFPELDEPRRSQRVLDGLDRLLSQERRFVAIWLPPSHNHDSEPHEDEKRSSLWIKTRREVLQAFCAGYIYVTSDPALTAKLARTLPKMKKAFPFPKVIVKSRDEALGSAEKLLAPPSFASRR